MSQENPPNFSQADKDRGARYWRVNIIFVTGLLVVWFVVSFLAGIVFVVPLNEVRIGGFPLGFWMAQQGSIIVFVILILAYAWIMQWVDRKFDVHED